MNHPTLINLVMKDGTQIILHDESTWDRIRYEWWLRLDIGISVLFGYHKSDWYSKLHLSIGNVWLEGEELIDFFNTIHLSEKYIPEILEQLSKMKFGN